MEKLRKIIGQADPALLEKLKISLKGSNSTKFYTLSMYYRDSSHSDDEIRELLNCTESSYYALKSRLFDKIQKLLLEKPEVKLAVKKTDNEGIDLLQYIYEYPSETSIAMLLELETRFLEEDSPGDLIDVYSALKKATFYTDKYYTYSQLYNNQVAYALAIEKSEEILINFNRTLATYYFTDAQQEVEIMELLLKEIKGAYSLYKSPRIEIIHHIIVTQMMLFAGLELPDEPSIDDLLHDCELIIKKFGNDRRIRYFQPVIRFLLFEYHFSLKQYKKALIYFDEVENVSQKWLLQNNCCLAFKFLLSKVQLYLVQGTPEHIGEGTEKMYIDHNDLHTSVIYKMYQSICHFYNKKIKLGITLLNEILNEVSFKNDFFIEADIKLTLALYYIYDHEDDLADLTLKAVSRKDPGDFGGKYRNIQQAAKLLSLINSKSAKSLQKARIAETFEQFEFYNSKSRKVLACLQPPLLKLVSAKR